MRLQVSIGWKGIGVDLMATKDELKSIGDLFKKSDSGTAQGWVQMIRIPEPMPDGIDAERLQQIIEDRIRQVVAKETGDGVCLHSKSKANNRWISVDDSMPEFATPSLISSPSLPHALIAVWEGRDLWRVVGGGITDGVTHWQPLPEKAK